MSAPVGRRLLLGAGVAALAASALGLALLAEPPAAPGATTTGAAAERAAWTGERGAAAREAGGASAADLADGAHALAALELPSLPADALAGRVVDPDGRPLEGVELSLIHGPGGPLAGGPAARGRTDAAGAFSWSAPPQGPGPYALRLRRAGSGARVEPLETGVAALIVLRPGAALEGRCLDPEGRPLPGRVTSYAAGSEQSAPVGEDGAFTLRDLAAEQALVRFEPAPRTGCLEVVESVTLRAGATAQVELVAARGQTLRGRVLDPAGAPLAGALVRARPWGGATAIEAVSDEGGAFTLAPLTPGAAELVAAHPRGLSCGPLPLDVPLGADPDPLELTLAPDPAVRGRVLGAGAPLVGALVQLTPDASTPGEARELRTDAAGAFHLAALPAGRWRVTAEAAGFARAELELEPALLGPEELVIALEPAAALRGVVRTAGGAPAAGAQVVLEGAGPRAAAVADARGAYELSGLSPGSFVLTARSPGAGPAFAAGELRPGEQATVELLLAAAQRLAGEVVDGEGRPLAGAVVRVIEGWGERTARSDLAGAFALADLGPGPYRLIAFAEGHARAELEDVRPGQPVRLVLEPERWVTGAVVDRAGAPVEVLVAPAEAPERARLFEDGRFVLEVGRATRELWIRPRPAGHHHHGAAGGEGHAPEPAPRLVSLPPGDAPLEVVLEPGGEASGVVVDERGEPVAGALFLFGIGAEEPTAGPTEGFDVLAVSEDDGRFALGGLPADGLALTVLHPDGTPLPVRLVPGDARRLVCPAGGRLRGRLEPPAAEVAVLLRGPVTRRLTSAADGTFEATGLPPGEYEALRLDTGGRARAFVRSGGEAELSLR